MAAAFPDGINTAGPTIARLMRQPIDYEVDVTRYEDGGADVNVNTCGALRWVLEYEGLSQADLTTLRSHYNDARGKVEDFQFYDRQTELIHSVRYADFKIGKHQKRWSGQVSITLETLG